MHIIESARGIIELLPHGFDVDLGRIDHPGETMKDGIFIANPAWKAANLIVEMDPYPHVNVPESRIGNRIYLEW